VKDLVFRAYRVRARYITTFEVMDFYSWKNFDKNVCRTEFRKIINRCNTKSENRK
jgi:hypothetical protein